MASTLLYKVWNSWPTRMGRAKMRICFVMLPVVRLVLLFFNAASSENFTCTYESHTGTVFNNINYYNCYFDEQDQSNVNNAKIRISFISYKLNEATTISSLYINGYDIKTDFLMKYMDNFEAFLLNLWYNKTPIILDTENIDLDDNYYNIQGY